LYGIEEQPTAFYLDRAVAIFSMNLETEIDAIESNQKKSAGQKKMAIRMLMARKLGMEPKFRSG